MRCLKKKNRWICSIPNMGVILPTLTKLVNTELGSG